MTSNSLQAPFSPHIAPMFKSHKGRGFYTYAHTQAYLFTCVCTREKITRVHNACVYLPRNTHTYTCTQTNVHAHLRMTRRVAYRPPSGAPLWVCTGGVCACVNSSSCSVHGINGDQYNSSLIIKYCTLIWASNGP